MNKGPSYSRRHGAKLHTASHWTKVLVLGFICGGAWTKPGVAAILIDDVTENATVVAGDLTASFENLVSGVFADMILAESLTAATIAQHNSVIGGEMIFLSGLVTMITSNEPASAHVTSIITFTSPEYQSPVYYEIIGSFQMAGLFGERHMFFSGFGSEDDSEPRHAVHTTLLFGGEWNEDFTFTGYLPPGMQHQLYLFAYSSPRLIMPEATHWGAGNVSYDLRMTFTVIPEPQMIGLMLSGLCLLVMRRSAV